MVVECFRALFYTGAVSTWVMQRHNSYRMAKQLRVGDTWKWFILFRNFSSVEFHAQVRFLSWLHFCLGFPCTGLSHIVHSFLSLFYWRKRHLSSLLAGLVFLRKFNFYSFLTALVGLEVFVTETRLLDTRSEGSRWRSNSFLGFVMAWYQCVSVYVTRSNNWRLRRWRNL